MAKKDATVTAPSARMLTGCDLVDLLIGGAKGVLGLPFGMVLNIIGDKSAGKTFLKNEIIAANYHALGDSFSWYSDDTETGDTFDTTGLYGVNIHPDDQKIGTKIMPDSTTVEEFDAHVKLFLDNLMPGNFGVYAVDSLDGLSDATREAMEEHRVNQLKKDIEVKDPGDYGAQIAKFLSQQFFRTKHQKLEDAKCSLVIVSQIRDKFNAMGYGQKWEVSCGKALEFYCHTRVFLKTIRQIKRQDDIVGAYVEATTIKSKTPRPYRKVYYTVYFDYGIDNIGSNLDYLFNLRDESGKLVDKTITWDGKKVKNLDNVIAWLESEGLKDKCKDDKKAASGKGSISLQYALEWIAQDAERQAKFNEVFGQTYTRDELAQLCREDPTMAAELTRRVQEKWEAHEDAIKTPWGSKYGNK